MGGRPLSLAEGMGIFAEIMVTLERHVLPHWPFVAVSGVLYIIGKILKKKVYTVGRAKKSRLFRALRGTMSLHPMLAGFLFGLVPGVPVSPGVEGTLAASIYYMLAGACASVLYDAIRGHNKWKLHISGLTDPPPAAPAPEQPEDDTPTTPGSKRPPAGVVQ